VRKIVLATTNPGKIREIEEILADAPCEIMRAERYFPLPHIDENGRTFFENALKKAKIYARHTGETVLADDSGLEVDFLQGSPGVYSARYAGIGATDEANLSKLLREMERAASSERNAVFRCVLVLCSPDGDHRAFEGRWAGQISEVARGTGGFGYDPVFFLPELGRTVAELTPEDKNRRSHRAQALHRLKEYLIQNGRVGLNFGQNGA